MTVRKVKTSNGSARFQVYVNDPVSKKKRYVGTFGRRQDAVEAEYEAKRRIRLGERLKPREQVTFAELGRRWLISLTAVRPATRNDYEKALHRLEPLIGQKLMASLTRRDVDAIVASLSAKYAPSTVRKTMTIAKMVFRLAVDHDIIDRSPVGGSRLTLPKARRRVFEPLSREEVGRLVACAPDYWQPFYQFLLTSGARRAEAWGLTTKDLDLDAGVVHIRHQLVKGCLVDLKSEAAYRRVPLPAQTVHALRQHMAARPENELDLVFPTESGKPVDAPNFYARVWVKTRDKAGLPRLRMHDCRHHVASVYLAQGRSIKYVQRLLGHAQAATLLNIYAWVTKDEEEIATAAMERWLAEEAWRATLLSVAPVTDVPCR